MKSLVVVSHPNDMRSGGAFVESVPFFARDLRSEKAVRRALERAFPGRRILSGAERSSVPGELEVLEVYLSDHPTDLSRITAGPATWGLESEPEKDVRSAPEALGGRC